MKPRILTLIGLCLLSSRALAAGADLSVSDESARLSLDFPLPSNNVMIDVSWLHHTDNGETLSLGGYVTGLAAGGGQALTAGVGTRFYYVDHDEGSREEGSSLTLGGFLRYQFPNYDRVAVGGSLFYGPGVLTFGDSDDFYEVGAWAGYSILQDAELYLGWRRIRTDFDDDGNTTMDSGLHIGLRARF